MTNTALTPTPTQTPTNGPEYHQAIAATRPAVWRGIVALLLLVITPIAGSLAFGTIARLIDYATGAWSPVTGAGLTPAFFAAMCLGLALLTPVSMVLQRVLFGVPMRSLHSIAGRFRWRLLGRVALIVVPIWVIYLTTFTALHPAAQTTYPFADLIAFTVIAILLAPLQSAGEEYAFRGLAMRIAASWGRGPRSGLIIGIIVSSALFMVGHLALDPWLNLYYFAFGVALAVITWRTGGLELAVLFHAVNNSLAFLIALVFSRDLAAGMDRSNGAGTALMIVPIVLLSIAAAVTWWRTRVAE